MNGVLVRKDGHRSSYTDTIVRTKGRAISRNPLSVVLDICLNRVFLKIELLIAVLLWYHIHVSLQDDTRVILIPCRSRFTNQHIADLVLKGLQTETLSVIH